LTINNLGSVRHKIAYDSIRNWVRWDRAGTVEKAGIDETIITWTDYNKEIEYVYWKETGVCEQYGPDAFYAWCYGSATSQVKVDSLKVAGQSASLWKSKFTEQFQWVSLDNQCLPLSTSQVGYFNTNFFNTTVGPAPASTWVMPPQCTQSPTPRGQGPQLNRFELHP
jgi:hypothetical protein